MSSKVKSSDKLSSKSKNTSDNESNDNSDNKPVKSKNSPKKSKSKKSDSDNDDNKSDKPKIKLTWKVIDCDQYNVDKQLIFGAPDLKSFKLSNGGKSNYFKVPMYSNNLDEKKTTGPVLVKLGSNKNKDGKFGGVFSFGVYENKSDKADKGPTFSTLLSLYSDNNNPTDKEKKSVVVVNDIVSACKKELIKHGSLFKKHISKYKESETEFEGMNLISQKDENSAPCMFVKLMYYYNKGDGTFGTKYYEVNEYGDPVYPDGQVILFKDGKPVDEQGNSVKLPEQQVINIEDIQKDTRYYVEPVVRFKEIYVSTAHQKIQVFIYDANARLSEKVSRRLISSSESKFVEDKNTTDDVMSVLQKDINKITMDS